MLTIVHPVSKAAGKGKKRSYDEAAPQVAKFIKNDSELVEISVGGSKMSIERGFERLSKDTKSPEAAAEEMFHRYPNSAKAFFTAVCRNCFAQGKGIQNHTFNECKSMGNKCVLTCPKCKTQKHWVTDCPF